MGMSLVPISVCLFLIALTFPLGSLGIRDSSLKIIVQPGTESCLYEDLTEADNVWIDYAVVYSSHRDHDINFQLSDPHGRPLVTEFRKSTSSSFLPIKIKGPYKVCFDNTGSRFGRKTISFQITSKNPSNPNWEKYNKKALIPEGDYDGRITYIKDVLNKLRLKLTEIQVLQDTHRATEARDRSIAESNFERVNLWSFVFIIFVVFIGLLQVYSVRSFFEDKNAFRKFMEYGRSRLYKNKY